jgi:hypothetical protein
MRTIWKKQLSMSEIQDIEIPNGATFLFAREQGDTPATIGHPVVWFSCDDAKPLVKRRLYIVGMGMQMPPEAQIYIGTTMHMGGRIVLHIFEGYPLTDD